MRGKSKSVLIITIILLFLFLLFIFIINAYSFNDVDVKSTKNKYYKNSNPINLSEIIENNTKIKRSEKLIVQEMGLEYTTLYKENSKLPNGVYRVIQLGEVGKQNGVIKQIYENDQLISEQLVSNNVIKNSTEKIIEIGTGKGYINTEVKKGDKVYVSANNLNLLEGQDIGSNILTKLDYNLEMEILDIYDNFYKVEIDGTYGYIIKDGVSKYNPNKDYSIANGENTVYSKQELLKNLRFDMDVGTQSNLSLEQFEAIFENNSYDKNNILKNNAKYFYYAEEQYNINGVFLAAIAVHESAWGTSTIARNKNNLFGYCAYDNSPYNSATNFETVAEGIDLVARVLVKNYLNPSGTVLSDGSLATGKYYSGKTIESVNMHYATDKNWSNCVYSWMEKLYNSLPE